MSKSQHKYQAHRNRLLAEDPCCYRCGIGHSEGQPLHYHHRIPQHTGKTDHTLGCLLCPRCHFVTHNMERRMHKVVDEHGYTHGTFAGQPRRKRERRKARAVRLTEAWT